MLDVDGRPDRPARQVPRLRTHAAGHRRSHRESPDGPTVRRSAPASPTPTGSRPTSGSSASSSALDHRRRTGEGQYIDLSQFEASTLVLDAGVIDAANTGRVAGPLGNRDLNHAPHGVYPCADDHTGPDRWVAIAVTTDDQWRRLAQIMDRQDWLESEALCDAAGRLAAQDALDDGITRWTSEPRQSAEVEQTAPGRRNPRPSSLEPSAMPTKTRSLPIAVTGGPATTPSSARCPTRVPPGG